jgi:hypothetical protein
MSSTSTLDIPNELTCLESLILSLTVSSHLRDGTTQRTTTDSIRSHRDESQDCRKP